MGKLEKLVFHKPVNAKGYVNSFMILTSILLLLTTLLLNLLWAFRTSAPKDFGSFYASGTAFINKTNPYNYFSDNVFIVKLDGQSIPCPNLNPPISLCFTTLFTILPLNVAYPTWQIISLLLYIFCIVILYKTFHFHKLKILWGINLAGCWHTIELGQIYIPLLFLMVIAWILMEKKKYIIAGVFIGLLIAIKPNFALWLVIMAVGGLWQTSLSALITAALVSVIPLITTGQEIYLQWMSASSAYNGYILLGNSSFFGLAAKMGEINLGFILSFVVFFLGIFVIIKYKPKNRSVHLIGLTLSLLCSPIAWTGYTIFLLPVLLTMKWNVIHKVVTIILSVPVLIMFSAVDQWQSFRIVFSWLYGFAILLLFGVTVYEILKGGNLFCSGKPPVNIPYFENNDI